MKAAILWETGKNLRVANELKVPDIKEGQVLVKMAYAGVCHSQLMETRGLRGHDPYVPHLLGHESTREIIAVDPEVSKDPPVSVTD